LWALETLREECVPDGVARSIGGRMNTQRTVFDSEAGAEALVAAVETTLEDLAVKVGGLDAHERTEQARIRQACKRLLQCEAEIGGELVVLGSTRQVRPHPLLKVEFDLRREIVDAVGKLVFRASQRRLIERANAIVTRPRRDEARTTSEGKGSR
jgi:hypothetical protein